MLILDLNSSQGFWQFRESHKGKWFPSDVPGNVHRDLINTQQIPNPHWNQNEEVVQWIGHCDWDYQTQFQANSELIQEKQIELVCESLDTLATLSLNGKMIGQSDNMFIAQRYNIADHILPGTNTLSIRFKSAEQAVTTLRPEHQPRDIMDPVGGCTRLRKQQCQFGWDWGPRLVTAGIAGDIHIEAYSHPRISGAAIEQIHSKKKVRLKTKPSLSNQKKLPRGYSWNIVITHPDGSNSTSDFLEQVIESPQLWWPNGQGEQPLYILELQLTYKDSVVDTWTRRIGLRTIEHRRESDEWGESFQFVVNGRPIFAKGANWIPAHSLTSGLKRGDLAPLLQSAVEANMNMIRAWAGGIYEQEAFYDLCDELGLLVWQDFMFACTLYPGDQEFLESIKQEAAYQVSRLRHRACLALWCGNNELESHNANELKQPTEKAAYNTVFRKILPNAVKKHDGVTAYWRSSPSVSERPKVRDHYKSGNAHFWQVWFARKPAQAYEEHIFRFVSEFGMQSFPSETTAKAFCPPDQLNAFSPTFEAHQKNPAGNSIILDYVFKRYRYARDYSSLAYLSQLNQAYCIQIGVEHYRRQQPRCSGALYWQLNDCWPGASWSSLEFGGNWKALHYTAKRFFAPALLTAHATSENPSTVNFNTVFDGPQSINTEIRWHLTHIDGTEILNGTHKARLTPGESKHRKVLKLHKHIQDWGADSVYLRYTLHKGVECLTENTLLFCEPRSIALSDSPIAITIKKKSNTQFSVSLQSSSYHHRVEVVSSRNEHLKLSDNFFDLYPNQTKTVEYRTEAPTTIKSLKQYLSSRSLVHTYE